MNEEKGYLESVPTESKLSEEKNSGQTKSSQDYVNRFMTRLKNGDFDEEFRRRREAEIGYGEPLELSKEGIAKEVEKFGQTLDFLAEIKPDEFGPKDIKKPEKTKEEVIETPTSFGKKVEEFSTDYDENNGFDVKEPENNIKPVSNDFNSFIVSASEGYAKTLKEQIESGISRTRNKD